MGSRTPDLYNAIVALYQLSYDPSAILYTNKYVEQKNITGILDHISLVLVLLIFVFIYN